MACSKMFMHAEHAVIVLDDYFVESVLHPSVFPWAHVGHREWFQDITPNHVRTAK